MTIPIQHVGAFPADTADTPAEQAPLKRYYSTLPTLVIRTSAGRMVQDETTGARLLHVGEKFAQFTPAPMAAPKPGEEEAPRYGVYETTDPEAQASLEKYVAEGGEIISEEEFKRRTTKPEDVIAAQKLQLIEQEKRIAALQRQLQVQQFGNGKGKGKDAESEK